MSTRITRPTLAELWRVLATCLEKVAEANEAPALARSLAIAGLLGRPARALGVGVEKRGDDYVVTCPGQPHPFRATRARESAVAICPHHRIGMRPKESDHRQLRLT